MGIAGVASGDEIVAKGQADALVKKMKEDIKNGVLPKKDAKKASKAKVIAKKHEADLHKEAIKNAAARAAAPKKKLLLDAVSVGEEVDGPATENFSSFFSKAQHHAESELEASTQALTGHASVSSIPAAQLKALAQMAAEELKKREHQQAVATALVEEPVQETLVEVQKEDVSVPITKVAVKPQAVSSKMAAPVHVQAKPAPVQAKKPVSADAMAALIKASVAKALGNNGVQFDEKAVDSQLVQIGA